MKSIWVPFFFVHDNHFLYQNKYYDGLGSGCLPALKISNNKLLAMRPYTVIDTWFTKSKKLTLRNIEYGANSTYNKIKCNDKDCLDSGCGISCTLVNKDSKLYTLNALWILSETVISHIITVLINILCYINRFDTENHITYKLRNFLLNKFIKIKED